MALLLYTLAMHNKPLEALKGTLVVDLQARVVVGLQDGHDACSRGSNAGSEGPPLSTCIARCTAQGQLPAAKQADCNKAEARRSRRMTSSSRQRCYEL